jgi:hypothetical protein
MVTKPIEVLWMMINDGLRHRDSLVAKRWELAERYAAGKNSRFEGKRQDVDQWKADTNTNLILADYLQKTAVMMRDIPKLSIDGRESIHAEYAKDVERLINQNWLANGFTEIQEESNWYLYWYGKTYLKLIYDGTMNRDLGGMAISAISPKCMVPQPGKTKHTGGEYLGELKSVDKMSLCRAYPDRAEEIKKLFTPKGFSNEWGSGAINAEEGAEGLRTDGTGLTMYYRERNSPPPASLTMVEMWMRDDTTVEKYGWVAEVSGTQLAYKRRKKNFSVFPTGRMIRFVGNLILEDKPNPFPQFPYVEVANINDCQEWPAGEADQLIPLQDLYDLQKNQQVDAVNAAIGGDKVLYSERAGVDPSQISNDPSERWVPVTNPGETKNIPAPVVSQAYFVMNDSTRSDFDRVSGYPEAQAESMDARSGYAYEVINEEKRGRLKLKTYSWETGVAELAKLQTLYIGMFYERGWHYTMETDLQGVTPDLFNYTVTAGLNLPASRRTTEQYLLNLFDKAGAIQTPLQAVLFEYIIEQSDLPNKDHLQEAASQQTKMVMQMAMAPPAPGPGANPNLQVVQ